ncbi:MAG: NAD-binding protein, partial [Thermodesulfobacteriota bacterium]
MDGYLIIGCGHFGSRAAKKLFQRDSNSKIIVVDKSRKALQRVSRLPIQTVVCD